MDTQPSIDRSLIIPILIGGFSVIGIIVVLLIGRSLNSPAEVPVTPSATPFQYIYLGTEPAITTPIIEGSEIVPLTEAPIDAPPALATSPALVTSPVLATSPVLVTPNHPSVSTPLILVTNTPPNITLRTSTPTRASTPTHTSTAAPANTYDDTDSRLSYSGSWIVQNGLTGSNAPYNGTLHISDAADNKSVTVQFSGQEIFFYYQSAPSFGIVTIYLDNEPLAFATVSQAQSGGVWYQALESAQTHIIRIEHTGGGSVNIDRFVIPAATPTPTRTPTPTQ